MIETPSVDWFAPSPTLALLGAAGLALMAAVLLPPWMRKGASATVAFAGFVVAAVLAGLVFDESPAAETLTDESMTRDRLAALTQVILAVPEPPSSSSPGPSAVGPDTASTTRCSRLPEPEWSFVGAGNLMTLFLGLEWFSLCLYVLVAFDTDRARRWRPVSST